MNRPATTKSPSRRPSVSRRFASAFTATNRMESATPRRTTNPACSTRSASRSVVGEKPIKKGKLSLETPDSESERTITTQEFVRQLDEKSVHHFQNIIMPGNMAAEVKATIDADGRSYEAEFGGVDGRLDLASQLILTIGSRVPDLRKALVQRARAAKPRGRIKTRTSLTTRRPGLASRPSKITWTLCRSTGSRTSRSM